LPRGWDVWTLRVVSVQIGGLRFDEIPQFLELLRLGFEGELSPRGPTSASAASSAQSAGSSWPEACLWLFARPTRSEAFVLVARAEGRVVGCLTILGRSEPSVTGTAMLPQSAAEEPPSPSSRRPSVAFVYAATVGASAAAVNEAGRRSAAPSPRSRAKPWARSVPSLFPGARAFLTCLADGSRRLSTLEKEEAYLTLPPTETRLACVALQAGFERVSPGSALRSTSRRPAPSAASGREATRSGRARRAPSPGRRP